MDSLTQIVLGAAVGELAQGKKMGNRAMIWGAIAGTIPDLDVFVGKLYKDPVDELAFHRGISHSFFFAATFSILMSFLTYWIYDKKQYQKPWFAYAFIGLLLAAILAILVGTGFSTIGWTGATVLFIPTLAYAVYRYRKTLAGNTFETLDIGVKGWYKLFFWSIITHPMLDCFTVYGTQILLPFSNRRVSFDNISVADPGYTVPFLICLIAAAFFTRKFKYRSNLNKLGLLLSSLYMVWTFYNKHQINTIVEKTLAEEKISYSRYMTSPTILNNVLWSTTVESDSVFYLGQYSFFDEERRFDLTPIPKNRHLITNGDGDHTIETLRWFSDNYYNTIIRKDGRLQVNDLRFGSFSGDGLDENDFIFRFVLDKRFDGSYHMDESEGGPPRGNEKEIFSKLWTRIKGEKSTKDNFSNAAVASAHPIASDVGIDIMKQGGNAYDAAVAVHFALAVVYPRAGNLGGGGFATIHTAGGISSTLDFRETAPAKAYRKMYLDDKEQVIPDLSLKGAKASGVPGSVKGMLVLHDSLGSLPIAKLLAPAIGLASKGFPLTANEADRLNRYRADFLQYNTFNIPYVSKQPWQKGDTLKNHLLAKTLRRLATEGLDEFYFGQTATLLVEHQQKTKGLISLNDMHQYRAKWRSPVICDYKGYSIVSMPPPSSGGVALCQILNGMEQLSISEHQHNSPSYIHKLAEVEKSVFAIRNELLGDPDQINISLSTLLSEQFTNPLFNEIDDKSSVQSRDSLLKHHRAKEVYETTHFSIVDRDRNALSLTTTLNGNYGSLAVVEGAGFLMNNEMDDFTTKPGVANQFGLLGSENNSIAPNKRMLSSMTPTIVLRDDKPYIVLGSPGGPTIITSVLQTIINVLDYDMELHDAVDAARFHNQGFPNGILMERTRMATETLQELERKGHQIRFADYIGAVEAIMIGPKDALHGAADQSRGKDDSVSGY